MYIDNVHRTSRATGERIVDEAVGWGLPRERATAIVEDLLEAAPGAIAAAREETEGVPGALVATVEGQLAQLQAG